MTTPPAPRKIPRARYWNVWWTLSVIFMALTFVVVMLEVFGVLKDVGIALAVLGVGLSLLFGLTGTSRLSVTEVGEATVTVATEVAGSREDIRAVGQEVRALGHDVRVMGQDVREGFGRLERVLRDRLPPR